MLALNRLAATRIVAKPSALDTADWPADSIVLRLAEDEALIIPPPSVPPFSPLGSDTNALSMAKMGGGDEYAIIVPEGGFCGQWVTAPEALALLARHCEWELPRARPAFAQGMVAGVPVKLWLEQERVLFIVPAPFAADLQERLV